MYIVTLINKDTKFWLRGTTWAFHADRANKFETYDDAVKALLKASKFMKPSLVKKAVIEGV